MSQVVVESDPNSNPTAIYVRAGDQLLSVMRPNGSGVLTPAYVHQDGLGSVRTIADVNGNLVDARSYEAFGTKNSEAGSEPLAYGFAGEPLDSTTHLAYHRARWMDSRVGRFTGTDRFAGLIARPATLHRYGYVWNNPANRRDPSGGEADDGGIGGTDGGGLIADASFSLAGGVFAMAGGPCNVASFTGDFTGKWPGGPTELQFGIAFSLELLPPSTRYGCTIDQGYTVFATDGAGGSKTVSPLTADYVGSGPRWWNGQYWNTDPPVGEWDNEGGTDIAIFVDAPGFGRDPSHPTIFPVTFNFTAVTRVTELFTGTPKAGLEWEFGFAAYGPNDFDETEFGPRPATPQELASW
ncbi:MAG: RHS repeat-associated core domain-containing protein [Polyangiaceae bacterium]